MDKIRIATCFIRFTCNAWPHAQSADRSSCTRKCEDGLGAHVEQNDGRGHSNASKGAGERAVAEMALRARKSLQTWADFTCIGCVVFPPLERRLGKGAAGRMVLIALCLDERLSLCCRTACPALITSRATYIHCKRNSAWYSPMHCHLHSACIPSLNVSFLANPRPPALPLLSMQQPFLC